jgi:hypothetical protein
MKRRSRTREGLLRATAKQQKAMAKLERRRERRRQVTLGAGDLPPGPRPGAPRDPRDTTSTRSLGPGA